MLTGLGFSPFYAAAICLLANTAPVAFGSIGTPILTLTTVTGLPMDQLSARVGQICAPISLIVPGVPARSHGRLEGAEGRAAGRDWRAAFRSPLTQFLVSNFVGPQLTDILSSLAAIGSLVCLFLVWKPKDTFDLGGHAEAGSAPKRHSRGELLLAWGPYAILVVFVLLWGFYKAELEHGQHRDLPGRGCTSRSYQVPPVVAEADALRRRLPVRMAGGVRDRLPPGRACCRRCCSGCLRASFRQGVRGHGEAARLSPLLTIAVGARAGVPDELLRRDGDAGAGLRRDGRAVPLLQFAARAGWGSSSPAATPRPTRCSATSRW